MNCQACKKLTENPKFCSRACSARVTNKTHPRRTKKSRICTKCHSKFTPAPKSKPVRMCEPCSKVYWVGTMKAWETKTIEHFIQKEPRHPTWAYSYIRELTRRRYKDERAKPCQKCGYDKHVEVCHIKPLTEFPVTATLEESCGPSNVMFLCPNCHWEFDHALSSCATGTKVFVLRPKLLFTLSTTLQGLSSEDQSLPG